MNHPQTIAAIAVYLLTATAAHAADQATACESVKLKAAGKYAACCLSADAKAVKTGDPADHSKCDEMLATKWAKAETVGAGACPNGTDDQTGIQDFLAVLSRSVAEVLAGTDPIPSPCVFPSHPHRTCFRWRRTLRTSRGRVCRTACGAPTVPCVGVPSA